MKQSRKIAAVVCLAAFSHVVALPALDVVRWALAPVEKPVAAALPEIEGYAHLGEAMAQTVTQNGQSTRSNPSGILTGSWSGADSIYYVTPSDGAGIPQTTDVSRDRDQFWRYTNAIQSQLFGGQRDSSAVLSFQGAKKVYISIFANSDSTIGSVLLGVQMRRHLVSSADSLSSMAVYRWGSLATAGVSDTFNTFASAYNGGRYQNDSTLMSSEFGVWVPGRNSAVPRTMTFELVDRNGQPVEPSPYFSVRVRPIVFRDPSGAGLNPYTSRRVSLQIGLYGTR